MKKVLFLGNSHVGAIRAGLDYFEDNSQLLPSGEFDFSFAGFKGSLLDQFYVNKSIELVPHDQTKNHSVFHTGAYNDSRQILPLNVYDFIVIVQGPSPLLPILYIDPRNPAPFISRALIKCICESLLTTRSLTSPGSANNIYWKRRDRFTHISESTYSILEHKDLNTIYLGSPVPCTTLSRQIHFCRDKFNVSEWNYVHEEIRRVCDLFNHSNTHESVKILLPPVEIFDESRIFSHDKFFEKPFDKFFDNSPSKLFATSLPAGPATSQNIDMWHANAKYGRLILDKFIRLFGVY